MREKHAEAWNKINGGSEEDGIEGKVNVVENGATTPSLFLFRPIIFFPSARPLSISSKKCPPPIISASIFALRLQQAGWNWKAHKARNNVDRYCGKEIPNFTGRKFSKFYKECIFNNNNCISSRKQVLTEIKIRDFNRFHVSFSSYASYFTDPYAFTSRAARSRYLIFVFRHISHRTFSMSNPK